MIRIIVFLIFLLVSGTAFSQTGMEILSKIALQYAPGTSLSVNITYFYYSAETAKEAETSLQTSLVQNKEGMYYKMDDIELIAQARNSLTVDHGNKTIGVVNYQNLGQVNMTFNPALLDTLARSGKIKLKVLTPANGLHGLLIEQPFGEVKKTELWYSPDSYLLRKVLLYYQEYEGFGQRVLKSRKMELQYANYKSTGIVLPKKLSDYVTILSKGYELKPAWKQYTRLN